MANDHKFCIIQDHWFLEFNNSMIIYAYCLYSDGFSLILNPCLHECLSSEMHQKVADSFFLLIAKGQIGQGNFLSMDVSPSILTLKAK